MRLDCNGHSWASIPRGSDSWQRRLGCPSSRACAGAAGKGLIFGRGLSSVAMASAAILNSRQSKTPICKDEWAINTVAAVGHATLFKEWDVISSVGMFTWDFVTWLRGSH